MIPLASVRPAHRRDRLRARRSAAITSAASNPYARASGSSTRRSTPASPSSTTPGNTTSTRAKIRMGRAIADRRERVFLMTKVCTHGRDAKVAMRQLEESLQAAEDRSSRSLAGARVRLLQRSRPPLRARRRHRGARSREAGRQGPLRRLHRPQGSRRSTCACCRTAIPSTPASCRSTCSTPRSGASSSACCPELLRQRIAPIGMKSLVRHGRGASRRRSSRRRTRCATR